MLRIEHLTREYGDNQLIEDLSLHIQPGEIYGLIGNNGSGKTTTLKCCSGVRQARSGEIFVNGISMQKKPLPCKAQIAYVPATPDLYVFMTGVQFLNFVGDIYNISTKDRQTQIDHYADLFELTDVLSQPISLYSNGTRKKLLIVSALMHDPKLLIMDEPFMSLDPKAVLQLQTQMRALCDRGGSVFVSTHVLEFAENLCDKVAIMQNGKLVRAGIVNEVKGDASLQTVLLELEDIHD